MKRKATKLDPKVRLAVKKETLKDLSPKENISGGFLMQDSIIVPPRR